MSYSTELKKNLKESSMKKKCCRKAYFYGEALFTPKKKNDADLSAYGYDEGESRSCIKNDNFKCHMCRSAFLRGVFTAAGTISDPCKSFHLEIKSRDEKLLDELFCFISDNCVEMKRLKRNDVFSLYLKKSDDIEDLMHYMGADKEAFEFTNEKIKRNILNQANRRSNFEVVNIQKTVDASQATKEAINILVKNGKMSDLPKGLAETARLRIENPIASLEELAMLHSDRISKSGVNHRLRKLIELAELD